MATTTQPAATNQLQEAIPAPVLGSIRLPAPEREGLVHSDGAPLHEVPKDTGAETGLARAEMLLGKGYFGATLREISALKLDDPVLRGRYAFVRHGKVSRAYIGVAERYALRGDGENARRFYQLCRCSVTSISATRRRN
jgi:hypothetical protein